MQVRSQRPGYDCPMCGAQVPDSLAATLWHNLARWHNPVAAWRHEWAERPVLLVALTIAGFVVGMGLMAATLTGIGR